MVQFLVIMALAATIVASIVFRERLRPQVWPTLRRRRRIVVAVLGVVVLVGGFFIARDLWFGMKPTPEFAVLADQPDPSLLGTVAFIETPNTNCVDVIAASGTPTRQLACFDKTPQTLVWLPDGRLEVTSYGKIGRPEDRWRTIVDARTGTREDVPQANIPNEAPPADGQGPSGERITSTSKNGRLRVTLTTTSGTRELLSVGAPYTYTIGSPVWSPDGRWFVAKDDLDQIVLITTTEPSRTRVLVKGGYAPATTSVTL